MSQIISRKNLMTSKGLNNNNTNDDMPLSLDGVIEIMLKIQKKQEELDNEN